LLYGTCFRRAILFMLWLKKQLDMQEHLPYLPPEVWLHIMSFVRRDWFKDEGVIGYYFPLTPHLAPVRRRSRQNLLAMTPPPRGVSPAVTAAAVRALGGSLQAVLDSDDVEWTEDDELVALEGTDIIPGHLGNDDNQGRVTPKLALDPEDAMDIESDNEPFGNSSSATTNSKFAEGGAVGAGTAAANGETTTTEVEEGILVRITWV